MNTDGLITLVQNAVTDASQNKSKLPPDTIPVQGMSGRMGRHLLNNLAAQLSPYVEVGTYFGSTLISAGYGNRGIVLGIDNFSIVFEHTQAGHNQRRQLLENMLAFSDVSKVSFMDASCWDVHLTGVQCFFYDGEHTVDDQRKALSLAREWCVPTFVYVVDDWNWECVQTGTQRGLDEFGFKVEYKVELGVGGFDSWQGFWNGMGVFVLSRT